MRKKNKGIEKNDEVKAIINVEFYSYLLQYHKGEREYSYVSKIIIYLYNFTLWLTIKLKHHIEFRTFYTHDERKPITNAKWSRNYE